MRTLTTAAATLALAVGLALTVTPANAGTGPACQYDLTRYAHGTAVVSVQQYRPGPGRVRIRIAKPGYNPLYRVTTERNYAEVSVPRSTRFVRVHLDGHVCEPT